jgi:glycosyltransferase involved in cell wall biosynthesis
MDRTPHVLLFTQGFLPPDQLTGGLRLSVSQQARFLAQRWRVTVVSPEILLPPLPRYASERRRTAQDTTDRRDDRMAPGLRVLRPRYIHVPLLFVLTEPLQLFLIGLWIRLRHARDARVVHGHRLYPMGLAAVLVAHASNLPAVITAHGSDLHTEAIRGPWRSRYWCRWALRRADRVVAVSRELFDIARSLGVSEERLRYVPNGVDVESFESGDREAGRRAMGLSATGRLIVSVGNLVAVKGHRVLIDAFRAVRERHQDVTLVIAGEGPLRSELEEQARSSGLAAHVLLLGRVAFGRVPDLLAAADVVALPSINEGMPLAALEALAAGRPLVSSAVGGAREIVEEGRHGLLVPAGDAAALATALDTALSRTWDEAILRERARQYSWKIIAEKVARIYAELPLRSQGPASPDG